MKRWKKEKHLLTKTNGQERNETWILTWAVFYYYHSTFLRLLQDIYCFIFFFFFTTYISFCWSHINEKKSKLWLWHHDGESNFQNDEIPTVHLIKKINASFSSATKRWLCNNCRSKHSSCIRQKNIRSFLCQQGHSWGDKIFYYIAKTCWEMEKWADLKLVGSGGERPTALPTAGKEAARQSLGYVTWSVDCFSFFFSFIR